MTGDFETREDWEKWLSKHHETETEVWVRLVKKGSGLRSVSYDEAVEVALCFGWIDGQRKSESEKTSLQRFTPRGKRSIWSKLNRERVERLIASGRVQPAGLEEVERAKADGRWDAAYDPPSRAEVPEDLKKALTPRAKKAFEGLDSRNRFAILFRVHNARKTETREKRIRRFVEMLERGQKLY